MPRIIKDGRGRPAVKAWSDFCERQAAPQELAAWSLIPNADISLACGFGGLIAGDVDDDRPEIIAAVRKTLPQCTVARRGSKGFAFLARYVGGRPKTLNIYRADEARKDPLVEVMGIGRSIATPPSIHARTGNEYVWWNFGTGKAHSAAWQLPPLAGLPVVTAADIERLIAALEPWSRKPRPTRPVADGPAPLLTDAVSKRYRAYALKGLADSTGGLAALTEGRPTELFRAACGLGWAVAHGVITEAGFINAFVAACETNGLAARDGRRAVEASIQSGLRWSEHDPLPKLEDRPRDHAPDLPARGNGGGSKNAKTERRAATTATAATHRGTKPEKNTNVTGRKLFSDEPLPLFRDLPGSEAFPVDALGPVLGGMARALHEAAVQSPMAICGTAVLAAAACATQGLRNIELPIARGQAKPLSLYFLAIALSGERKTATDKEALDPIRKRSDELRRDYDDALPNYRNAHDAWEAERKAILGKRNDDVAGRRAKLQALGREPSAPKSPILILQEPTLEG